MGTKYRVNIPLGLESLLEGLAGAVLREQPIDIYRFAAEYFEKLLASRDEGTVPTVKILLHFRSSKVHFEWTTRQGRNICILLHVFSSNFCAENEPRNENFKKKTTLLLKQKVFSWHCLALVSKNSNFPLTRKTKVHVSQIAY